MTSITYHVASSLDGFIAHEDGTFDGFSWDDEVIGDFLGDVGTFGTVLMGRKTYEVGLKEGKTSPYPMMRQIVFSQTVEESPDDAVELVRGDVADFVRSLKADADAPIWLCGGGEIASILMNAGLIDRVGRQAESDCTRKRHSAVQRSADAGQIDAARHESVRVRRRPAHV